MTPTEQAEKIHKKYCWCIEGRECFFVAEFTAQIEEAQAEEFAKGAIDQQNRCKESQHDICDKAYTEGFRAAREKAAGILDVEASRYTDKTKGHPEVAKLMQAKWEALKRAKRAIRAMTFTVNKEL
jgi:hypothetical protein